MKNEREKEIDGVKLLNRRSGGFLKDKDKARQQITDQQQQTANISISRVQREIKTKGDVYALNGKERAAKE